MLEKPSFSKAISTDPQKAGVVPNYSELNRRGEIQTTRVCVEFAIQWRDRTKDIMRLSVESGLEVMRLWQMGERAFMAKSGMHSIMAIDHIEPRWEKYYGPRLDKALQDGGLLQEQLDARIANLHADRPTGLHAGTADQVLLEGGEAL